MMEIFLLIAKNLIVIQVKSIGIEICYSKGGGVRYGVAEENAVQYIAKLLKQYGWGIWANEETSGLEQQVLSPPYIDRKSLE